MPARHCVIVADLAGLESAFEMPVSAYSEEFLQQRPAGDRIREYAELAFANEAQIQQLRKGDRETMVMARRLRSTGQDSLSELPSHLGTPLGQYARTRTSSQFKWLLHAFSASGRPWIQEAACGAGREWVEEVLNLLFVQRGFAGSPEEAEDPVPVGEEAFRFLPREDGTVHFRLTPPFAVPTVARTLEAIDLSPEAFAEAGRETAPRLQDLAREFTTRLRTFLRLPFPRPAVLSFIGA
jgi:hypothetical protein